MSIWVGFELYNFTLLPVLSLCFLCVNVRVSFFLLPDLPCHYGLYPSGAVRRNYPRPSLRVFCHVILSQKEKAFRVPCLPGSASSTHMGAELLPQPLAVR